MLLEHVNDLRRSTTADKYVRDLTLTAELYALCDWIVCDRQVVMSDNKSIVLAIASSVLAIVSNG